MLRSVQASEGPVIGMVQQSAGGAFYFASRTFAALVRFQDAYADQILTPSNLTRGTGYFGNATRALVAASV